MALWGPIINRSRRLAEAEKKNSEEPVEAVKPAEEINEKEIDWEERRFQVVLSLLAHDGAPGGLWTFNERAKLVFQKADMVIGAYKKFCEKMK